MPELWESGLFSSTLQESSYEFLEPSRALFDNTLACLKQTLDPLARDVSEEQHRRQADLRWKRKRKQSVGDERVSRLKYIQTDGFEIDAIWRQVQRVVDAAREEIQRDFEAAPGRSWSRAGEGIEEDIGIAVEESGNHDEDLGVEGVDYSIEEEDTGESEWEHADGDVLEISEADEDLTSDNANDLENTPHDENADQESSPDFVADKFGLNDGFFSIDDFNKQSEFLEQQDTRGGGEDAASDEEEVDFDADPLAQTISGGQADDEDAGHDSDEENGEGPTFGDPDASSEDDEEDVQGGELDDAAGMSNTNKIMYADFFAPPAQKKRNKIKSRPSQHKHTEAPVPAASGLEDDSLVRTMAAVHRDLFEESEEEEEQEERGSVDHSDVRSRRSAHERRKAEIAEEIRRLEAANVAKRQWQLTGEAHAADRPINSLLEEDLEFERAGKPVPVITAEVSESIEELIRRRILAHEFEDVIRRRPDDLVTGQNGKRGRLNFELDDNKSKKGLAEEYEEEHLRRTDPNYVDVKDEKVREEQNEVERLWKEVCSQLDSLSSWNFRPKQPVPQLNIRADAPVVTMEDARPDGGEVSGASQLAPQEIYKAGDAIDKRQEVAGKSGLPSAREEISREAKKRRRRREKERSRKASSNESVKPQSNDANDKKNILQELRRGDVKIIGKKGVTTNVEGKDVNTSVGKQGAAHFLL